jgi:hypothetical protein
MSDPMDCELATNLLSARLDGQLAAADAPLLDAHLATCEPCRLTAEALAQLDESLTESFAPRRAAATAVAERVIHRIQLESPAVSTKSRAWWLPMILSAAAGFALAFVVLAPWKKPTTTAVDKTANPATIPAVTQPLGKLSVATGAIELQLPGQSDWTVMPTGGAIPPNARVRTPDGVRCEFLMADASEVRLNGGTELVFTSPRAFNLVAGQVFTSVRPGPTIFEVALADASVSSAAETQFDLLATAPSAAVLTVVEGATRVRGRAAEQLVKTGERVKLDRGTLGEKQAVRNLTIATNWVNELLVMKGRDNQELVKRIDHLFAEIGRTKLEQLYEEEIKALGDHCVIPLTRYIQSPRSKEEPYRRTKAMQILGDMAQPWSIPDLIPMLDDDSADVRYHAARALRRLAGTDLNISPENWRDRRDPKLVKSWDNWWATNKHRYPRSPLQQPLDEKDPKDFKEPPVKAKA